MCVYICMYIYIYIYVYLCMYMHIHVDSLQLDVAHLPHAASHQVTLTHKRPFRGGIPGDGFGIWGRFWSHFAENSLQKYKPVRN